MAGEILAGLSAFSTMLNIAKSMKDMDDAVKRNSAVFDLGEQILATQARYAAAIQEIDALKKELTRFETWEAEKEKYELQQVHPGAFACVPKPTGNAASPAHWLCATCYEDRKKSILQYFGRAPGDNRLALYKCQRPGCGMFIRVHYTKNPGGGSGPD